MDDEDNFDWEASRKLLDELLERIRQKCEGEVPDHLRVDRERPSSFGRRVSNNYGTATKYELASAMRDMAVEFSFHPALVIFYTEMGIASIPDFRNAFAAGHDWQAEILKARAQVRAKIL